MRPTADRVRESLFARLGDLAGTRVLDLYAGSGALGIEALSRGAASALFVDRAEGCTRRLRRTLDELGLAGSARVWRAETGVALTRLARAGERFDRVFLDPPYGEAELARALAVLSASGILHPDAVVVAEGGRRHPPGEVDGLVKQDERRHGDTIIARYTPVGAPAGTGGAEHP